MGEARDAFAQEGGDLEDLAAALDHGVGDVAQLGAVLVHDAGGVEIPLARARVAAEQHVLARHGDLASRLGGPPFGGELEVGLAVGLERGVVHAGHLENHRHRLHRAVARAALLDGHAGERGDVAVAGGIDHHFCADDLAALLRLDDDAGQARALAKDGGGLGEEVGRDAGVEDEAVEHDLGGLAVVGAAGAVFVAPRVPAAGLGPALDELQEDAFHERIGHDGAEDAGGPGAAEAAEALDEYGAGAVARGGDGGADAAGAASDHEHIALGDDGETTRGLFNKLRGGFHGPARVGSNPRPRPTGRLTEIMEKLTKFRLRHAGAETRKNGPRGRRRIGQSTTRIGVDQGLAL